ncbi:hypothetical protein ACNRD9_22735 [Ralstonia pseudosolanacearum]|uniref:hypothetical protein n=1 Tax=Ralstonia pseudosolanacearum TaxID=1310165 RepID=UPI0005C765CB|nr:hypothetical protein [Ralstonia pseudosolanacearum]MCK4150283.1 hypothetical protein [Ralstonia pseudosolanacearum]BCL90022.1 hypothetical protein MAFF211471_51100 [Ralstonia solanacearum]BCN02586.1 hypothetical protein RPSA_51220 [Ralstonia solanacearum]
MSVWKLSLGTAIAMFHMHAMSAMVVDSTTGCQVFVEYPQPGEVSPAYQAVLPGGVYEDYVAQFVIAARKELTHWGLDGQAVVMLSVLNAKAVTLGIQRPYANPETGNFDRDVLIVPDVELPDKSDVRLELRPLFLIWSGSQRVSQDRRTTIPTVTGFLCNPEIRACQLF